MLILILLTIIGCSAYFSSPFGYGPPRFRQNVRTMQEVYLGDTARFKCTAVGKPAPKVYWYREGRYLNYSDLTQQNSRVRENKKHMSLDLKRVEVSDQGAWACQVWNSEGSIWRNFTLDIIDFCDYFLTEHYPGERVPERCQCLWYLSGEQRRIGIDWSKVTDARCEIYRTDPLFYQRTPFGRVPCFIRPCADPHAVRVGQHGLFDISVGNDIPDVSHVLPDLLPAHKLVELRPALVNWTLLDDDQKAAMAQQLLLADDPRAGAGTDDDDNDSSTTTTTTSVTASSASRVPATLGPVLVPPYFKVRDEDALLTVVLPAGRTVKLACPAGGKPDPQVVWHKDGKMLIASTVRSVGGNYKLRRWTLEMEDAAQSDSGDYVCEVFNSGGEIRRKFSVNVVERLRSKPIIVPNVLVNQTVDVNSTVNFTCKVISDLTPHIVWMRVDPINDSYVQWNATYRKYDLRMTDMSLAPNADITQYKDSSTLTIYNVQMSDEGMYACVTGNSLGNSMANATLRVTEFHAMTLDTVDLTMHNNNNNSLFTWIIFAIVFCLLIVAVIMAACFYRCRRNDKTHVGNYTVVIKPRFDDSDGWSDMPTGYDIHIETVGAIPGRPRLSSAGIDSDLTTGLSEYEIDIDPKWEIDRNRLEIGSAIGEGAFGQVMKGTLQLPPGEFSTTPTLLPVAVKMLKASAQDKELVDLISEMQTFKIIGEHENILRLIGCCTNTGKSSMGPYVIVELCDQGNLRDFLRRHRPKEYAPALDSVEGKNSNTSDYLEPRSSQGKRTLSAQPSNDVDQQQLIVLTQWDLVQFAWQVARGMEFMASRKIIHRDLAARNVLVADGYVLKISDFGLSRDVHYNDYYRKKGNGRLPIKWMALEALDSHVYTVHSDVWSYGILLWEIMTLGGTPYPSIAMPQLFNCLKEGYRMESPHDCPNGIYQLMVNCWLEKPETRPSFKQISDYLEWLLAETAPPQPEYLEVQSICTDIYDEQSDTGSSSTTRGRHRMPRPLSAPGVISIVDDEHSPLLVDHAEVHHPPTLPPRIKQRATTDSGCHQRSPTSVDRSAPSPNPDNTIISTSTRKTRFSDSSAYGDSMVLYNDYSERPLVPSSTKQQRTTGSRKNRRYSIDSQSSSGRGGSSAMSSAEGLGIGEFCQIEYAPTHIDHYSSKSRESVV